MIRTNARARAHQQTHTQNFGIDLHFQMQPAVTSVVSTHRTAVITPLKLQLRIFIALHKMNCV